jgi:chromosome segregation ATPase
MAQLDSLIVKERESEDKLITRDRKVQELQRLRKEMAERIASREQELIKYGKALREIEQDYNQEREKRMSQELKVLNAENEAEKCKLQLKDLHSTLSRNQVELEEFSRLKLQTSELKRTIEDSSRREKQFLGEIDQLNSRERKLFSKCEELENHDRNYNQEMIKLQDKLTNLMTLNEQLRDREYRLKQDLESANKDCSGNQLQVAKLEGLVKQYQVFMIN